MGQKRGPRHISIHQQSFQQSEQGNSKEKENSFQEMVLEQLSEHI